MTIKEAMKPRQCSRNIPFVISMCKLNLAHNVIQFIVTNGNLNESSSNTTTGY